MHYAVPRILSGAGVLERFYTDICAVKGWPNLLRAIPQALRPAKLQRLLTRQPRGVPARRITAFTGFGFEYARRLSHARNTDDRNDAFLWSGQEFCRRVIAHGFGQARAVWGFNSASLELLQAARERGLRGVVEQTITPRQIEWSLLEEEQARFPDWEPHPEPGKLEEYCARERAEWAAADLVVCGSDYVRDGLIACGAAPEKCVAVSYGLDFMVPPHAPRRRAMPLKVLTVGAVCLRKGSPYVLEAARRMRGRAVFRMVGPVQVQPAAETALRADLELVGVVPRSDIRAHYAWADVFLLPSLCEGSATVSYEALFNGLPVICTPHTGSVARDGIDGYLVPARDVDAIVERLDRLATDPALLTGMSEHAHARSQDYTLARYGQRLVETLRARLGDDALTPAR